jgi:ribonuclease-3
MTKKDLQSHFEKKLGISLKKPDLLKQVFIHRSYVNETRDDAIQHNERLEFLGDAVLELVVTEYLYRNYDNSEGEMTNWRSALVRGEMLAQVANKLNIGDYLFLSHGEEKGGGRDKDYILANTVEALIGYLYLTEGYTICQNFIQDFILCHLEEILEKKLYVDAKSYFQEQSQDKLGITPEYKVLNEEGPDHDKVFTMGAYIGEELMGEGKGSSKQNAEQEAARAAIRKKGW